MRSVQTRRLSAVLTAVLALSFAACNATTSPSIPPDATGSLAPPLIATAPASAVTSAAPTLPATFPMTLTDDEGTAVALGALPKKIVSITPASTEALFAIGAGKSVVATDETSDYPADAAGLPHVATFSSVDVEKITALGADLVIAGGLGFSPADAISQLRSLKIPVLVLYASSVDGVYHDIELLGAATGTSAKAASVTAAMRTDIDAVHAAAAAAGTPPRVYYEVGYTESTGQIFAPAAQSFVAEMVTLAGGDAITTSDPSTYEIPLEVLIERDPQVIVLGVNPFYAPTPAQVKARAGWGVMTAVKDGQIRTVRDTEITRPGPRLPTGLRNLTMAIWPGISLPPAP